MNKIRSLLERADKYYEKGSNSLETKCGFIKVYHSYSYEKAREYLNKALELWLAALGENNEIQEEDVDYYFDHDEPFIDCINPSIKHVEFIYDFITMWPSTDSENDDDLAVIYTKIGDIFACIFTHNKAEHYFEKAIFTKHDLPTALSLNFIGNKYHNMYDDKKALEYYNKALEIILPETGENSIYAAAVYNNIGGIYRTNDHEKSLGYYTKALKILCSEFDEDDINVAAVHYNIGCTYYYMKDFGKAYKHLKSSRKTLFSVLDGDDIYISDYREIINSIKFCKLKWILSILAVISAISILLLCR